MHQDNHQADTEDFLELIKDVKDLLAIVAIALGFLILTGITSCTKQQREQVKTVIAAADKGSEEGCILFEQLKIQQGTVEDICLGTEAVREAVVDYKRKKAASAASAAPPASAAPAPATKIGRASCRARGQV